VNGTTGEDSGSARDASDNYTETWDNTNLANGAVDAKLSYAYDDGSTYTIDTLTQADSSYTDTWARSNGSSGTDSLDAAGTLAVHTWEQPDGSSGTDVINLVSGENSGARSYPGGNTSTYDDLNLAGGATEAKTSYLNADGSSGTEDKVTQTDGSYVDDLTYGDTGFQHESFDAATGEDTGSSRQAGDGYVQTWDNKPLASGAVEAKQTLAYDDGSTYATDQVTQADGSYVQTWTARDGTYGVAAVGAQSGAGDDFDWGRGSGSGMLQSFTGNDRLDVGPGVAEDQLWFHQDGSNLDISIIGTQDQMVVNGWFNGSANQLQAITLSTGETIVGSDVQQLVNAMATFAVPDAAQAAYTPQERSALTPVLAATWH